MHAYLLIGKNSESIALKIEELTKSLKAKKLSFDLQKIEDARAIKKIIKFSFSELTAIIIENIDSSTNESLNAFLKNLEEPNTNIIYILTAKNINNVIPTIVSRCEIVKVKGQKENINDDEILKFMNMSINEKLEFIGKIKERSEAINLVEGIIYIEYKNSNFKNIESYLSVLRNLNANGNVSLQLTYLVVTMNSQAKS